MTPPLTNISFGLILRTELHFDNTGTDRNKFLVIVGERKTPAEFLFFITSSKIHKFPSEQIVEKNILKIEPGKIACFPLETIIDCRMIHKRPRKWFEARMASGSISSHGSLPGDCQDKIKKIVFASLLISQADREVVMKNL